VYSADRIEAIKAWLVSLPHPQVIGRPANWPAPGY
jgi:hypothetical protein